MKKAVVLGMILLALGTLVYAADAGVKVTGWGRGLFAIQGGGDEALGTINESWGGNSVRSTVTITGTSDNVGFVMDIDTNNGNPVAGDQDKIWAKPFDMLTLSVGRIYDDTLRGSESYGAWNWLRYGNMSGDGAIFDRVGEGAEVNFEAALAPTDALYFFGGLGGNGTNLMAAPDTSAERVFHGGQFGAGYTINGIGVVRAQYVGSPGGLHLTDVIGAAFKVTAVPNLTADFGFRYATKPDVSPWDEKISVGADYTAMEALVLHAIGVIGLDKVNDTTLEFGAGADYTVDKASGIGINADVRFLNDAAAFNATTNTSGKSQIGFLFGVFKSFANGVVGIGVEAQTTGLFAAGPDNQTDQSKMVWAIPIKVEMSF